MISLEEHRGKLINLPTTIAALDAIDELIAHYSDIGPGVAYCTFNTGPRGDVSMQFSRPIILTALHAQRTVLVEYLATLGIVVNELPK